MKITTAIDRYLFRHGFRNEGVRWLVRNQIVLTLILLAFTPGCFLVSWVFDLIVGGVLGTLNFYALARVVQRLIFLRQGSVSLLLIGFYARLGLTGVALYILIAWYRASGVALLAGLSLVLVTLLIYGAKCFAGQNLKEA